MLIPDIRVMSVRLIKGAPASGLQRKREAVHVHTSGNPTNSTHSNQFTAQISKKWKENRNQGRMKENRKAGRKDTR